MKPFWFPFVKFPEMGVAMLWDGDMIGSYGVEGLDMAKNGV